MIKLGKAFSDNVILSKTRQNNPSKKIFGWGIRLTLFYVFLVGSFFLLTIRLFHLTLVEGKDHRELSEDNRIKTTVIHAPRGIIFDRRGIQLVVNIPAYRINICQHGQNCKMEFKTRDDWKKVKDTYPPVSLEPDFLREYSRPYSLAHILGYLNEITAGEINNPFYEYQSYLLGDRLGRMGLEQEYEKILRGIDGKELNEVDSRGQVIRTLGKVDPDMGKNLYLTLDADLQQVAYDAMGEYVGAVIVSKPKTGEILALVSTPSFNPNKIHEGLTALQYKQLVNSADKPLYNRAISGVYPPGSTFKIIAAAGALESGKMKSSTIVEDTGKLTIGDFSFSNWLYTQYGQTDGRVNMVKGIARSNDIYFYKLGENVGVKTIAEWGKTFGIGRKSGIDLFNESEGVMPDPEWRKKVRNEEWYLGDTYHLAIGQGDLVVTPLQVNLWTATIANGGKLCRPHMLSQKNDIKSARIECQDLRLKSDTIDIITEGMRRVCFSGSEVEYSGTAYPFFNFTISKEVLNKSRGETQKKRLPVACKTGTAEIGDPQNRTHAWFTAFAPLKSDITKNSSVSAILGEPEIAVTVLVEKGGEGSAVAAPVAKKIFEEWFKR